MPPKIKKPQPVTPPTDPEAELLQHVVTLGTLIKIVGVLSGVLIAIGAYEVGQLDKLRDQATTLRTARAIPIGTLMPKGGSGLYKDTCLSWTVLVTTFSWLPC